MKNVLKVILILIGCGILFLVAKSNYVKIEKGKDFKPIESKFIGKKLFGSGDGGNTYKLYYSYVVDKVEYNISINYGTAAIPPIGTVKTIMYNPQNPNDAYFTGLGPDVFFIMLAYAFIVFPLISLINCIFKTKQKIKEFLLTGAVGFFFLIIGIGTYLYFCDGSDSLSLIYLLKAVGLKGLCFIPFVGFGIYIIIKNISVFFSNSDYGDINNKKVDNTTTGNLVENNVIHQMKSVVNYTAPKIKFFAGIVKTIALFTVLGYILKFIAMANDPTTKIILFAFFAFILSICLAVVLPLIVNLIRTYLIKKSPDKIDSFELIINKTKNIGWKILKILLIITFVGFLVYFFVM